MTLDKTSAVIGVGAQLQLNATVSPENTTDKNVVWASSDPSVATVDENGLVKAIAKGEAKITASSSNGKSAECAVTVSVPVSGVTLSETEKTLDAGRFLSVDGDDLACRRGKQERFVEFVCG